MPEPTTPMLDEFPDVIAEFGGHKSPNIYSQSTDRDCEEWPEPDEDDLDILGLSSQAATIDYPCTRRELAEAGYGGAYSEQDLSAMPELDSEFMAPAVAEEPRDYLPEPAGCALRGLLDSVEQWDWTALPGFLRLASDLIDGLCEPCPLIGTP